MQQPNKDLQSLVGALTKALNQGKQKPPAGGKKQRNRAPRSQVPRTVPSSTGQSDQIGAVVRTRLTKQGMSDLVRHRICWVIGYSYVGNGTNGAANTVYFVPNSQAYFVKTYSAGTSSGLVPILACDTNLGQAYISDIEKHYARKRVNRMWLHADSLQPSTANNMMIVIAPRRGAGVMGGAADWATIGNTTASNAVGNVTSMKGAVSVDSWESKTIDISSFIAGGSGAKQNEFEISALSANSNVVTNSQDLDGVAPACFALAGNSTTAALQATIVHQISVEQEVDYLDYTGGIAQAFPLE